MRILILGASGYTGSCIKKKLAQEFMDVYGTYKTRQVKFRRDPSMHQFALGTKGELERLLYEVRPTLVVSCLRGSFHQQMEAHKVLGEYLAQYKDGKIIYLSSANVFDGALEQAHMESDLPKAESGYGKFKIDCENMLQKILGQRAVILRIPEIWGKDCPRLAELKKSLSDGQPIQTYGNFWVNYTTNAQIASWVSYIIKHDLCGVFHVGTRDLYGYMDFQEALASRMQVGEPMFEIEHNQEKQVQAVLPGRQEIPEELHMDVEDVLNYVVGRGA